MKSNTLKKIIFSVVVIIGFLVVDIIFLIHTNNAINEISVLKKEVVKESIPLKNISETRSKTQQLQNIEEELNSLIIEENQVVSFIGIVEDLSSQNNLSIEINNVDFSEPEKENDLGSLGMTFQVRGAWSSVTRFITEIENVSYLVNIESLRLSAFSNSGGVGWSANISLKGFTK